MMRAFAAQLIVEGALGLLKLAFGVHRHAAGEHLKAKHNDEEAKRAAATGEHLYRIEVEVAPGRWVLEQLYDMHGHVVENKFFSMRGAEGAVAGGEEVHPADKRARRIVCR
jgi:hypothetical protein